MNLESYLEENEYVANHYGTYIYSAEKHSVNLLFVMDEIKDLVKDELINFIKANPRATTETIKTFIEQL